MKLFLDGSSERWRFNDRSGVVETLERKPVVWVRRPTNSPRDESELGTFIAAAPDFYSALRFIANTCSGDFFTDAEKVRVIGDIARSALAKASADTKEGSER